MAGSQSGGKGGGGHASNAALDDNEDVKVRRGETLPGLDGRAPQRRVEF